MARGILATLDQEMSRATTGKLTKDATLFISARGDLVRNRTLIRQRHGEEMAEMEQQQLQLQREAIEKYRKGLKGRPEEHEESGEAIGSMIELEASLSARDAISELIEESTEYYQRHKTLQPSTPPISSNRLHYQRPPSSFVDHAVDDDAALLDGTVSFVQQPQQKNVMVFFSSDAPDPSDSSVGGQFIEEIRQQCMLPYSVLSGASTYFARFGSGGKSH